MLTVEFKIAIYYTCGLTQDFYILSKRSRHHKHFSYNNGPSCSRLYQHKMSIILLLAGMRVGIRSVTVGFIVPI